MDEREPSLNRAPWRSSSCATTQMAFNHFEEKFMTTFDEQGVFTTH
jgi:hypothetical protein